MRYKIGDKIVIRNDLVVGNKYYMDDKNTSTIVVESMLYLRTGEFIIDKIFCDMGYIISEYGWLITDEMIDHEASAKLNEVKPIDLLENGMTVGLRDGSMHLVLTNVQYLDKGVKFALVGNDTFRSVSVDYRDDLTSKMFITSDIMAIYKPLVSSLSRMLADNSNLIWERKPEPKVIKITSSELLAKLGLDENTKLEIEM